VTDLNLIRQLAEEVLSRAVETARMQTPFVVTERTRLTIDERLALAEAIDERVSQASVAVTWPDQPGRLFTIGPAVSGQEPGLRTRMIAKVEAWFNSPDDLAANDEMAAQVTDVALAEVQPELDAKDAEIRQLQTVLEGDLAEAQGVLRRTKAIQDCTERHFVTLRERAERAEAELDRLKAEVREYQQANTKLQQLNVWRTDERNRLLVLIRDAMTIRMYGQRAPGSTENWADWDRAAETELRGLDGHLGDNEAESTLDIQRDRDRLRAAQERVREALPYLDGQITGLEQLRPETGDTFRKTFNHLRAALDQAPAEEASTDADT